jgi:hypothetical protein
MGIVNMKQHFRHEMLIDSSHSISLLTALKVDIFVNQTFNVFFLLFKEKKSYFTDGARVKTFLAER